MRNFFFDRASSMDDYCLHVEALGACQPGLDHAKPFRDKTFGDWVDAYVASDETDNWGAWCLVNTWHDLDDVVRKAFYKNIARPISAQGLLEAKASELATDQITALVRIVRDSPIVASRCYVKNFDVLSPDQRTQLLETFHSKKAPDGKAKLPNMERKLEAGAFGREKAVG